MDISSTLEPNSDQLDAVELLGGPRIFTIESVSKGNAEQPVNVFLAEFPRPWRPGKSMRRVLAFCWGVDAAQWAGRRAELFCDADVVFGGKAVGRTRISRLSHIDGTKKIPLLVTKGKSAVYIVEPLPDAPQPAGDLQQRITNMVAAYSKAGVTHAMLEAREGRAMSEWDEGNVASLSALFEALKAGEKKKADEFPEAVAQGADTPEDAS